MTSQSLLAELMICAPYQPATNYWRAIEVEEIVRFGFPAGTGLDLGCGDGHLMTIILNRIGKRDIVGIDVDREETIMAGDRHVYQEVITTAGDRLPISDRRFDFVFSNSVLEHVVEIDQTLREVARVLRPGGSFMFTVPGPEFHSCLRGPWFGRREDYLLEVDNRCAHLRYWSVREWSDHLSQAGLALTHQHGYLSMPQLRRWESIARCTSGILFSLARRKRQPIEIQRQLGIRSSRLRLPKTFASMVGKILGGAVRTGEGHYTCLFIEARKP